MCERYHGWPMDALRERMEFVGTLSWLAHGCSVGTDGVCGNVIMVGPWMLCGDGWSMWNVVMVGPWMLCVSGWSLWERYHGWPMDALCERMEFVGTLSWLAHGCSA